ncbi:hypothetical protein [Pseudonocardia sp.]|uniref:hypothetical protein n=1 Tax=Pseudonocardia sp. TaxID=60912 RepID=UPI003D0ABCAB
MCALTSITHEIADTEFTRAVTGRYRAVCGAVVAASPMCVPEGRRCEACADLRAQAEARHGRRRAMRRPA